MTLKKIGLITLLAASSLLSACSGCSNSHDESSDPGQSGDIPEGYVRVFFYTDFTQPDTGEFYTSVDIEIGSKVAAPTTPEKATFPEFPVFLGWSAKEVIDDKKDLWNFSTDTVTPAEGANTFAIYGIWVAEGEA